MRLWNLQEQQQPALGLGQPAAPPIAAQPIGEIRHQQPVMAVAMSPEGHVFSAGCDNKAMLWQPSTQGGPQQPRQIAEVRDAWEWVIWLLLLLLLTEPRFLRLGLTESVTNTHQQQHAAPIKALAYVNQLQCCVTGSWDQTVRFWDMRQPTPAHQIQVRSSFSSSLSPRPVFKSTRRFGRGGDSLTDPPRR